MQIENIAELSSSGLSPTSFILFCLIGLAVGLVLGSIISDDADSSGMLVACFVVVPMAFISIIAFSSNEETDVVSFEDQLETHYGIVFTETPDLPSEDEPLVVVENVRLNDDSLADKVQIYLYDEDMVKLSASSNNSEYVELEPVN